VQIEANKGAPYKINWTTASGDTLIWQNLMFPGQSTREVYVSFAGAEADPLVWYSLGIDYPFYVIIDARFEPLNPKARLWGSHDGFPAFEIYIDGTTIYTFDPSVTGDSIISLAPPMEKFVHVKKNL
jgi:hypothetical protein